MPFDNERICPYKSINILITVVPSGGGGRLLCEVDYYNVKAEGNDRLGGDLPLASYCVSSKAMYRTS